MNTRPKLVAAKAYLSSFLSSLLILIMGCSHQAQNNSEKLEFKKYASDQVTVETALFMAQSAYLRGCVEELHEQDKKLVFASCLQKAQDFVQKDIIFILEQDGSPK